jgi:hypothetical protein
MSGEFAQQLGVNGSNPLLCGKNPPPWISDQQE